jgi:hypothetical protein
MWNCKRFMAIVYVVLLFALAWPNDGHAASDPVFTIKREDAEREIKLVIEADKLTDLYAFEVKLTFDATKLRFKSATSGLAGFAITPIVDGKQLVFAATKIGKKPGDNGRLKLANLHFESIGRGAAEVTLTEVKLVNSALETLLIKPQAKLLTGLGGIVEWSDIQGHWAQAYIERAADFGIINGYADGSFRPNNPVTRVEFAAMLVRALDLPTEPRGPVSFTDAGSVPGWASGYVAAAAKAGIIAGYTDGTFRPNASINRSEMVVMLARALNWEPDSVKQSSFKDREHIPAWAQPAVAMAEEAGLIKGRGGNLFAPGGVASRAEAVKTLLALMER